MIGILIVSHGMFSKSLLDTAEMIMGKQENVKALTLSYETDAQAFQEEIEKGLSELDCGDGVVVLADLLGGTPSNAVAFCLRQHSFPAITGMNLPMLIECLSSREDGLGPDELAEHAERRAKEGVRNIAELLSGSK